MTLSAALSSATSSLRAIQTRMAVATNNIANADDVNYSAKTAKQTTSVAGGQGYGVTITGIESSVDSNLVRQIVEATSSDSAAQIFLQYMQSLSDSLGTLSSDGAGDTLASALSSLEGTLDELATTPESDTLKGQAVTDLEDAAADLRMASEEVQDLRTKADGDIADSVATVNDALHQIDALNDAITRAKASNQPTADLEDQRNAALQTVAGQMDITTYEDGNGALKVYTGSGTLLVGSDVHELSFTEAGSVGAADTYPDTLSGISVDGKDITASIRSGSLSSLITLRDATLPATQKELDALAIELRDTLNAVANQGSAMPPPNSLTGTESVTATTPLSASGTLRVALTYADGNQAAAEDVSLAGITTVDDLLTALNAISGVSASLNSAGQLVIEATDGSQGIALSGGTIGSENVSGFFGLNDIVTGTGAGDLAVRPSLSADPSQFPIGTLNTSATSGENAVSAGSGKLAQAMADALRKADVTGDAGKVVSNVAAKLSSAKTRASSAETNLNTLVDGFSSQYGVNVDEETARIAELQNAYSASAKVLSAVQSMFDDLLQAVR